MTPSDGVLRTALPRGARVAIIAGSGRLPVEVAEGLADQGHERFLVPVIGEADLALGLSGVEREPIEIEAFAELTPLLKRRGATHAVLAGGIARRPVLRRVRPSLRLLLLLGKALPAFSKGDNALLSALVSDIESAGIKVLGAHQVVPDLLAGPGPLARARPTAADRRDLEAALEAARAIGALDIGQAAIAVGGRVVALEGIEGTAGLLERMRGLRGHGRLAGRTGGALVKAAKPGQELRADLPSIGPETVAAAHAAGLAGIGLEAGRAMVLDSAETVRRADALGLFIVGLPPAGSAGP